MYCLRCLYPLFALASRTCPECGRPFDPRDPATFGSRSRRPFMVWVALPMRLAIAASIILSLIVATTQTSIDGEIIAGFLIYGISLLCSLGLAIGHRRGLRAMGIYRGCLALDAASIVGYAVTVGLLAVT